MDKKETTRRPDHQGHPPPRRQDASRLRGATIGRIEWQGETFIEKE